MLLLKDIKLRLIELLVVVGSSLGDIKLMNGGYWIDNDINGM